MDLWVLANARGMVAKVMAFGAALTELIVPDRSGNPADVVLGYDRLDDYASRGHYFGVTVGRVANRIAGGRFSLNGVEHRLAVNAGRNHLHGGVKGFDKVVWEARAVPSPEGDAVAFAYTSRDGEEGYPGTCRVGVTYTLTDRNELHIDYEAASDRDTPVNLTNHSYFNLSGPDGRNPRSSGSILDHVLTLNADAFTPVDADLLPTGEIRPVAGTPMDFRQPTPIGARIRETGGNPLGYDHNFAVNGGGGALALVARVADPRSGRVMTVSSTEPGVQFYTGNFLDGAVAGKGGVAYRQYAGFCLETQHFPDSVHHPHFPSCILRAGEIRRSRTVFAFGH